MLSSQLIRPKLSCFQRGFGGAFKKIPFWSAKFLVLAMQYLFRTYKEVVFFSFSQAISCD